MKREFTAKVKSFNAEVLKVSKDIFLELTIRNKKLKMEVLRILNIRNNYKEHLEQKYSHMIDKKLEFIM